MLIKSLPEEERPQEKALRNGVGALSDTELIALILRTGRRIIKYTVRGYRKAKKVIPEKALSVRERKREEHYAKIGER